MTAPSCPGDALAALVDGELDHGARERVLRHLTACGACRAEVEAQRRLKARLQGVAGTAPAPSAALTDRLLALAAPPPPPPVVGAPVPVRAGRAREDRPAAPAVAVRPGGSRRPPRPAGSRRERLRRRTATVSMLAAVGLGTALALGGPTGGPSTPVDPATDAFVVDFISTSSEVPLTDPAVGAAFLSAE